MANIGIETAEAYRASGLCCLPAAKAKKHPAIGSWKTWQQRLPTQVEVKAWFSNPHDAICCIAGSVSGNLECLDFDNKGELFGAWVDKIDTSLLASLVIEQSPSGGYHVLYRSEEAVDGNLKLARGIRDGKEKTLIETRGEGGLFLCAPSDGYVLQQGELTNLPVLTQDARRTLLDAARSLDELPRADHATDAPSRNTGDPGAPGEPSPRDGWEVSPGDDFNTRGDIHQLLADAGWSFGGVKQDGNEQWTRPGKDPRIGISATYKDGCFWVFSSNASPFAPNVKYNPFAVYATLRHNGDFKAAAADLIRQGYGRAKDAASGVEINLDARQATRGATIDLSAQKPKPKRRRTIGELVELYPKLRPPLIHGLLRIGETMNIIAPPKTGKSWLVTDLALSVASGTPWFGFPCEQGKVLIIDNELHGETSANRIPKVIAARGVDFRSVRDDIVVENQRGSLGTIVDLAGEIEELKKENYKMVIIDAFYRALPKDTDENDNGSVAGLYNLIDKYAAALDCSFVLIHHTSKGNQSQKSVTDVGAGAGAQSRAADTHVILRRHKDREAVVMESVVRSFPSVPPMCLRWKWPLWNLDETLDPSDLDGKLEIAVRKDDPPPQEIADRLAELLKPNDPQPKGVFEDKVRVAYGIMIKTAKMAVDSAVARGLVGCGRLPNQPRGMQATKFIYLPGEAGKDS